MDPINESFFKGFTGELSKTAVPAAVVAAPAAKGLAQKLVAAIRKRPITASATGVAAGAGGATGVQEVKEKQEQQKRRRQKVRQLLLARLQQGGYYG